MKDYTLDEIRVLAKAAASKLASVGADIAANMTAGDVRDIMKRLDAEKFSDEEFLFIAAQHIGGALRELGIMRTDKMFSQKPELEKDEEWDKNPYEDP